MASSLESAIDRPAGRDPAIADLIEDRLCALLLDIAGPATFNEAGSTDGDTFRRLLFDKSPPGAAPGSLKGMVLHATHGDHSGTGTAQG